METKVLYLSDGDMMLYDGNAASTLPSIRKEQYMNTLHDLAERNAWKYQGAGAQFQHRHNPYETASEHADTSCRVTAALPCKGKVLYALVTPDMGGLYLRSADAQDRTEGSWLADRAFQAEDMHLRGDMLACALSSPNLEAHIALMEVGSTRYRIITQGDTRDSAPFLGADGQTLYYASAGYARDEVGRVLARGPSAILRLNLRTGSLDELCADDACDYLRPKEGPDGAVYAIRRPYRQQGPKRLSIADRAKNVGSFFKGMGKLISLIGDPERAKKTPQIAGQTKEATQQRMLEGMLLDIANTKAAPEDDTAGFVPDTWVLVRREPDGTVTEVLRGVADYDFDGEAIVYTNGRRVIRVQDGKKTVLCRGAFIPRVCVWRED